MNRNLLCSLRLSHVLNRLSPRLVEVAPLAEMRYPMLQMRKSLPIALLLALVVGPSGASAASVDVAQAPPPAAGAPDLAAQALAAFQARHKSVTTLVAQNAASAALQTEVDLLLDYDELAQAALGGSEAYASTCKDQCSQFNALLGELIRENYLRLVRQANGSEVEYLGTAVSKKSNAVKLSTRVKAAASGKNKTVQIDYVMQQRDGKWLVVDIITEGISLRKTYRFEFKKILDRPGAEGGIGGVIAKIQAKLAEIAADKPAAPAPTPAKK